MRWAAAQCPPPDDNCLLPLLRTVRFALLPPAYLESVVADPRLQGALGARLFSAAFVAQVHGPRVGRRRGLGPAKGRKGPPGANLFVVRRMRRGEVDGLTHVWRHGMTAWAELGEVGELKQADSSPRVCTGTRARVHVPVSVPACLCLIAVLSILSLVPAMILT